MALEQFAYIAEIIGVLVVTASLLYLAKQVSHNTKQLETQSYQAWVASNVHINMSMADPKISAIIAKGNFNSANLDDAEKALGRKFDYCVPNNYRLVSEATNQGVMLSKIEKRSNVEKSIRDMIGDVRKSLTELGARPEVQPSD